MRWESLFENGSLIDLDIGFWRGARKLLDQDLGLDLGPAAERVFSLGRKRLVPKERIQAFGKIEHAARKAVDEASLPFPLAGARFIPAGKVAALDAALRTLEAEFSAEARAFAAAYPALRDEVRPLLVQAADEVWRSVANGNGTNGAEGLTREAFEARFLSRIESAYPDARALARKFRCRWKWFAVTAPKDAGITEETAIEAAERARIREEVRTRVLAEEEADVREAVAGMASDLRTQLLGPISFVLEKVKAGQAVNERSLRNIRRVAERVQGLNFLGDAKLDAAVRELRGSLAGVSAEDVRTVDGVRSQLRTAFSAVASEIQSLAVEEVESMAEGLELGKRRFRI